MRRPDTTRAEQLLGWRPTVPSEEGLRRTVAWFAAHAGAAASRPTPAVISERSTAAARPASTWVRGSRGAACAAPRVEPESEHGPPRRSHCPAPCRRPPSSSPPAIAAVLAGRRAGLVADRRRGDDCDDRQDRRGHRRPRARRPGPALLADPMPLGGGACAVAEVTAQEPLQTVGDLGALRRRRAARRCGCRTPRSGRPAPASAPLEPAGSMATSPVVLATSRAAAEQLGWTDAAARPGARRSRRPPARRARPRRERRGAVRAGRGARLAGRRAGRRQRRRPGRAGRGRASGPIAPADALAAGAEGGADAPLVPVSEQEVLRRQQGRRRTPAGRRLPERGLAGAGLPGAAGRPAARRSAAAADAVVRALAPRRPRSALARARASGTSDGAAPAGAGAATGIQETAPRRWRWTPADVQALFAPAVQPGHAVAAARGLRRLHLDGGAGRRRHPGDPGPGRRPRARWPSSRTTPRSALWAFACRLDGDSDWSELVPTRALDADAGGQTQREVLDAAARQIPAGSPPAAPACTTRPWRRSAPRATTTTRPR